MRIALISCLLACGSRDAPPPPPPAITESPPPAAAGATWSGDAIEPRPIPAQPAPFPLQDVIRVLPTSHGWIGTRFRSLGGIRSIDDIVDAKGVFASATSAQLVGDGDTVYVVTETEGAPPKVARIAGRKLVPLSGDTGLGWVFGATGIANDTRDGLKTQHWQTLAIAGDKLTVVETSQGPYATGATRLGNEVIVATREHDPPASTADKAAALIAADKGDTAAFAGLVGQPRGWLLHVDAKGHLVSSELFAEQPPSQVVATKSGWLVIATEGTAGRMFKDGYLLARGPADPALHVLAHEIELGSQLIAAGDWACLYTMPGDNRVVHCVDPVRRIHITSQPLPDNVTLYGIELTPKPRLLLHHTWYREHGKPPAEDDLELALP